MGIIKCSFSVSLFYAFQLRSTSKISLEVQLQFWNRTNEKHVLSVWNITDSTWLDYIGRSRNKSFALTQKDTSFTKIVLPIQSVEQLVLSYFSLSQLMILNAA